MTVLRILLPSVESYFADNNSYASMNMNALPDANSLLNYDQSIKSGDFTIASATATTYCVATNTAGPDKLNQWSVSGPGAVYHNTADCS